MVPKEIAESHDFETKYMCVQVGYIGQEDEQPIEVVKKEEEDERVSRREIEEDKNQNIVTKEEWLKIVDYGQCRTDEI